jgi:hypothetical protein
MVCPIERNRIEPARDRRGPPASRVEPRRPSPSVQFSPQPLASLNLPCASASDRSDRLLTQGVIYIFRTIGCSDVSRPSKARRPVLNLRTFLSVGPFLPLASSRGTSASPLATRQNSPGI